MEKNKAKRKNQKCQREGLASILGIRGVLPEVMTSAQQTEDIKAR